MPIPSTYTSGLADVFIPTSVNVMLISLNIISGLTNAFGLIFLIYQSTITLKPAQISSTPPANSL